MILQGKTFSQHARDFLGAFLRATTALIVYALVLMGLIYVGIENVTAIGLSFFIMFAPFLFNWLVEVKRSGRDVLGELKRWTKSGAKDTIDFFRGLLYFVGAVILIGVAFLVIAGAFSFLAGLSATTIIIILLAIIAFK